MNARPRRIGLSRDGFNGPSLHGKKIYTYGSSSDWLPTAFKPASNEDEKDITRSPQSTDDEDTDSTPPSLKTEHNSLQLTKRNLRDCDFDALREQTSLTTSSEAHIGSSPLSSSRSMEDAASSQLKKFRAEPATELKQTPDKLFATLGCHRNLRNPVKYSRQGQSGRREIKTYLSKSDLPVPSFKSPPENLEMASPPKKFKRPETEIDLDSPAEKKIFKLPHAEPSPEPSPSKPRFKAPECLDSPLKERASPKFKTFDFIASPVKERSPEPVFREIADSFEDGPSSLDIEFINPPAPYISAKIGDESQSQVPVFRIPAKITEFVGNGHKQQSNKSTDPFEDSDLFMDKNIQDIDLPETKLDRATCPMCSEAVDSEFLRMYNDGNPMNVRMQIKFCRAHKKRSARDTWMFRGYPTIDWESLDERIAKHHYFLQDILDGASSYYRGIHSESVKSGKNRTLKQSMMSSAMPVGPGYYGSRGLRAMSENIMNMFSPQLRKIAVKDRLVAVRGVTGYVQSVLVPELATRLIAEDMEVTAEDAREIMRESMGLGDLLNDELQDIVVIKEGETL